MKLDKNKKRVLQQDSAAAGTTAAKLVGQLLDDKFGGRQVKTAGKDSVEAIQKQVDRLEKTLKSKK